MALYILQRCKGYIQPLIFLLIATCAATLALLRMTIGEPSSLLNIAKVKDAIFGQFWLIMGPTIAKGDQETSVPALVAQASGIVLELGPGIGSQLPRCDKSKITKVYGVEPCLHLHDALRKQVKESGLTDIYEILPCGIQDVMGLKRHGITLGSIDTVLSVQVLCSVPDPDEMMRRLYALMKPGGKLIVYEHVKSTDSVSMMVQNFYNVVWPFFVGDCHLDRNTLQSIMQAGKWGKNELTVPTAEDAWTPLPRIHGELRKAT